MIFEFMSILPADHQHYSYVQPSRKQGAPFLLAAPRARTEPTQSTDFINVCCTS